jgi:hypothetical protein
LPRSPTFDGTSRRVADSHSISSHRTSRTHDGPDEYRRIVWVERDHANQVMRVFFRHERWRDGKKQEEAVVEHAMRWFFRFEVEHLLARAGFAIESLYGGFDGRPFDGNGEIIVVAQPTS